MNTGWIKKLTNNGYHIEFRQSKDPYYTDVVVRNTETDQWLGLTVSFDFLNGSAIDMIEFIKSEWKEHHGEAPLLSEANVSGNGD
jgi:hypothetical protein